MASSCQNFSSLLNKTEHGYLCFHFQLRIPRIFKNEWRLRQTTLEALMTNSYIILGWIGFAIQLTCCFKSEGFLLKDSFHPVRSRQNPTRLFASHLTVFVSVTTALCFSSFFRNQTFHSNTNTFPQAMHGYLVLHWLLFFSTKTYFEPRKHTRAGTKELFTHATWTKFTTCSMDLNYNNVCI